EQHKTVEAHFAHLAVHGTLHLHGYDHLNDDQAGLMESIEVSTLLNLGYPNPYLIT
ncbi:MAG: rRNA maturation RNase YbeY, partial [Methylophilaceae bacterium]